MDWIYAFPPLREGGDGDPAYAAEAPILALDAYFGSNTLSTT